MRLVYYLVLKPLSYMPVWYLYGLSNVLFFFIYRIFKYRRSVVMKNLKNSFPERDEKELKQIEKKFYRHLCDLIVESIRVFSISREKAIERLKILDPSVLNSLYDQGRSALLVGGHYSNWEMLAVAIDGQIKHDTYAVYFPLKNKFMNERMLTSREKYGLNMITSKQVKKVLEDAKKDNKPVVLILATDQSPSNPDNAYWMEFLNQDTGVLFGTEKYSKDYDLPIVFGVIDKVKRGHYEVIMELLIERPGKYEYGKITEIHTRELEKVIRKKPHLWLWSHKRWKKKRPDNANIPR